jgi:hypothetical protein
VAPKATPAAAAPKDKPAGVVPSKKNDFKTVDEVIAYCRQVDAK